MAHTKDGTAPRAPSPDDTIDESIVSTEGSRRHRPVSSPQFPDPIGAAPRSSSRLDVAAAPAPPLSDDLRILLWQVVHSFLLAPHPAFTSGTDHGIAGRPAVRRVWAAEPMAGDPNQVPEDIADLLEGWFAIVQPADAFAFVEAVHDNLELPNQQKFAAACNVALDRGCSDRRFVNRRLMPIASRTDIATIERALAACKPPHMADVEAHLLDALDRFAQKPEADFRGAIQEAIRAVEEAAFVLTGERPVSMDDALEDLVRRGFVDGAIKAAYGGLFTYATSTRHRTTQDDARLIVVMCAGFLAHLAAKM